MNLYKDENVIKNMSKKELKRATK